LYPLISPFLFKTFLPGLHLEDNNIVALAEVSETILIK